jgi:hypothetical protein
MPAGERVVVNPVEVEYCQQLVEVADRQEFS